MNAVKVLENLIKSQQQKIADQADEITALQTLTSSQAQDLDKLKTDVAELQSVRGP